MTAEIQIRVRDVRRGDRIVGYDDEIVRATGTCTGQVCIWFQSTRYTEIPYDRVATAEEMAASDKAYRILKAGRPGEVEHA